MRGLNLRRFKSEPTPGLHAELGITNLDLLNNLDQQAPVSPVIDNAEPAGIVSDMDAFLSSIDRGGGASDLSASDFATQQSPVTQQGFSGSTFSMPTYAAEGLRVPFHILSKRSDARRKQQEQEAMEQVQFDTEITQLSDEIRNDLFLDKRHDAFIGKLDEIQGALGPGTSRSQASKYMTENGIDRLMTSQWNNLASLYNKTFQSYIKVASDTDALGRSRYDPATKRLAGEFKAFIDNLDNFNPDNIDAYAEFYNKFNESVSISDLAAQAAGRIKNVSPENLDEALDIMWRTYGDPDFTSEQERLFKENVRYYYENKLGQREELEIRNEDAIRIKELEIGGRSELSVQEHEQELVEIAASGEQARETAAVKEDVKPETRITVTDQVISVTDPITGTNVSIDSKNVITFPDRTKKMNAVPGKNVYIVGGYRIVGEDEDTPKRQGWLTINESVDINPIREFKASVRNKDKNARKEVFKEEGKVKPKGKLIRNYFVGGDDKGEGAEEGTFVQAEINAAGTRRGPDYEEIEQDVVKATDSDGNEVEIRGKETIILPQANISDKLINVYGKNYQKAKAPKEKIEIKVSEYNKEKGTNHTKAWLQQQLGDKYTVVD